MATKYDESIILPGGKLILNEDMNTKNSITFQRKVVEDPDPELVQDFIEINCKIIIDKPNHVGYINVLKDFIPMGGRPEDGEKKIDETSNLVILKTKSTGPVYSLNLHACDLMFGFDKNVAGQIVLTLTSKDITKTDHAVKTDHSSMPLV